MDGHAQGQRRDDGCAATRALLLALSLLFPLALLTISFLLACQSSVGSTELLTNEGFESGTSGWLSPPHTVFTTVTEPVYSGQCAASLDASGTSSEIYIFQDVSVIPQSAYTLTGQIYNHQTRFTEACLRIEWLYSASPGVEYCLQGQYEGYRPITIGLAIAPSGTTTARIMVMAKTDVAEPPGPVYFDDLSFTSGNAPAPTPTPITVYLPLVLKGYASPILRSRSAPRFLTIHARRLAESSP